MKQKLFNHEKNGECCICKYSKEAPGENEVICYYKGIMRPDGSCKKFRYDPLKRKPKIRTLQTFTAEDFVLNLPDEYDMTDKKEKNPSNKIATIVNFVRSVEPRVEDDSFLLSTLEKELQLCDSFDMPSTVLFQYDALISSDYIELVSRHPLAETGLWLEIVKPLCEKVEIEWRGRYVWDWNVNCAYLIAYTPDERRKLIDAAFAKYKETFGRYPECVGSWMLDAFSIAYMKEKYNIVAACICKEQYGTDGITLNGGYYNGGYYPCKNNALCPAGNKENQIDVPVFRMLGIDPLYQYDNGLGNPEIAQGVCTLEPACTKAGGNPEWVKWYLAENYNNKCLSAAFAQFGQENSFGWDKIGPGLCSQLELLQNEAGSKNIDILTLSKAGKSFKKQFEETPETAICTDTDYKNDGNKGVWYCSKNYRINLFSHKGCVKIRDLHIFDDKYPEQYLNTACKTNKAGQFNLPVMDGFRFSKGDVKAGIVPVGVSPSELLSVAVNNEIIGTAGKLSFDMYPDKIVVKDIEDDWHLEFVTADVRYLPYEKVTPKELFMEFMGFADSKYKYSLKLDKGNFVQENGKIKIKPEDGEIVFLMNS